jgi:hypothetical protein
MWGPGPWGPPMMWGFGWIFPLIGLAIALVCVIAMLRWVARGGGPCAWAGIRAMASKRRSNCVARFVSFEKKSIG